MTEHQEIHFVDTLIAALSENSEAAKKRFNTVPKMPKCIPSEFHLLWVDIAFSFTFGRYFAALCVCGSFIEYFLEKAIPKFWEINELSVEELPESLNKLIILAVDIGLVSSDDGDSLHGIRKYVRNKFNHGDLAKAADSLFSIENITMISLKDGTPEIDTWAENQLSVLRDKTLGTRLEYAQWQYAKRCIPWIGNWVRRTALSLWSDEDND